MQWTFGDSLKVQHGIAAGKKPIEIAREMGNVTSQQVRTRMRALGLYDCPSDRKHKADEPRSEVRVRAREEVAQRTETVNSDKRFQEAMTRAISRGRETATAGIITSDKPFTALKTYRPEPIFSGCSSSASMCAELGSSQPI